MSNGTLANIEIAEMKTNGILSKVSNYVSNSVSNFDDTIGSSTLIMVSKVPVTRPKLRLIPLIKRQITKQCAST